jgi:alpha-glucosidase (family GH31 glycosyl hydrolase)
LPYLYSMVWATHRMGLPLMRAMWLAFPGDAKALAVDDAYMWGDALLVAPVTAAGAKERAVYLPEGTWYEYWSETQWKGGGEVSAKCELATLPLYVRAGAILPAGPVKQFATEKVDGPLQVHVYPGADGRFSLYEDDGVSMDYARGVSSVIEMEWIDATRTLQLRLPDRSRLHPFTTKRMVVHVAGETATKNVVFEGSPLRVAI